MCRYWVFKYIYIYVPDKIKQIVNHCEEPVIVKCFPKDLFKNLVPDVEH
jgi:hypothetical protein